IVQSGLKLFPGAAILIVLPDGNKLRAAALAEADPARAKALRSRWPVSFTREYMHGIAILDRRIVDIPDAREVPLELAAGAQNFLASGYRAQTIMPMMCGGDAIGALSVVRLAPGALSDKQIAVLRTFADQAVIAIENTRLLSELRRRTDDLTESLERQTATAEVLQVINASPGDLAPVFEAILEKAHSRCAAALGSLGMYDGEMWRAVAMHGYPEALVERLRQGTRVSDNPLLRPLLDGADLVHITDMAGIDHPIARANVEFGIHTLLIVPLRKDGALIGTISAARHEIHPFSDKQIELLTNFASQAVIAIENTRLLSELRQRTDDLSEALEQQTATSEVLKVISSSPGVLEPVFNAMLENAVRICSAKFGILFLSEGDAFRTVALHGAPPAYAEARRREPVVRPRTGTALTRASMLKQPVQIADVKAEPAYHSDPSRSGFLDLAGARTVVAVPMLKEGEVVGAVLIYRQEVRPFTDKQIDLLTNFAAQAVIAIENTRLLSELRESLQQQTATADVLKVISRSTFDLQPVLNTLTESAARLCEAYDSSIFLRQGESLHHRAHHGPIPQDLADLPIGRGFVNGRAFVDRAPVHVHDLQVSAHEFPDGSKAALRLGHRTVLAVPLLREDEAIGTLQIRRTEVKPFTDKQIELATTFADQALIAIENARLFDEVQARTRELSESLEQQTATSEVLQVISSSPGELEPVFNAMLANA
ncbi:MAG: GAF domain-containing protein, partial [Pseudolabrys sp.]